MSAKTSNGLRKTYSGIFGNQVVLKNRYGKIIMTILPNHSVTLSITL